MGRRRRVLGGTCLGELIPCHEIGESRPDRRGACSSSACSARSSLPLVLPPGMLASVQPASGQASTIQTSGEALRASNYTAALQLIEPALRESPNDPRLWSMQGMALSGLRRAPEALRSE